MDRLYLVPAVTCWKGGIEIPGSYCPKYFTGNPSLVSVEWGAIEYGYQTSFLVGCVNISQANHDLLAAQADVTAVPEVLDNTVPAAALATVQAELEALKLPGDWVTTAHTWRYVVRVVSHVMFFAQRHFALHNQKVLPGTQNLDLTWAELPLDLRNNLRATADDMGLLYDWVLATTTVRELLKGIAQQSDTVPVIVGGITV